MAQKEVSNAPAEEKRKLIDPGNTQIPIYKQCDLLELSRSSYYYEQERDDSYNLCLITLIDEQSPGPHFMESPG